MLKIKELKPKHIFYPCAIEMEHLEDVEKMFKIVTVYYNHSTTLASDEASTLCHELKSIIDRHK